MSADHETCARESRMLTLQVAAEAGSVVPRTIRRAIARGELTGYHVAGAVRVDAAELTAWLRSRPIDAVMP